MKRKARKNPAAVALGRQGGQARWSGTSAEERRGILAELARARWKKLSPEERSRILKRVAAAKKRKIRRRRGT